MIGRPMKLETWLKIAQILSLPEGAVVIGGVAAGGGGAGGGGVLEGGAPAGGTVVPGPEPTGIAESRGSLMGGKAEKPTFRTSEMGGRPFRYFGFSAFQRLVCQVNCTFGALRSVGSSILNSSAGRKPNMPAKITFGNVSRVVL